MRGLNKSPRLATVALIVDDAMALAPRAPHNARDPGSNRPDSPPPIARPGQRPPTAYPPNRPPQGGRASATCSRGMSMPPIATLPPSRPPFCCPTGYRYRPRRPGQDLSPPLFDRRSYFNDWHRMGLRPVSLFFVWVRFGPDLLIVDKRNGRIHDVVFDRFYHY